MRRLLAAVAAVGVLTATGTAAAAPGPVFTVVPAAPETMTFASAQVPNGSSLVLPPAYLTPRQSNGLPFPVLHSMWQRAGATYGIPWQVLAAINKVESNFGRNMGPSSAGAIGWMQFMPSTWLRWGTDANGDGVSDPWDAQDAIYSAARYLAAAGGTTDISRGVFAYNHAQWYVDEVLGLARLYGENGVDMPFTYDKLGARLQDARKTVAKESRSVLRAKAVEQRLARKAAAVAAKADRAKLLSDRLELERKAFQADARRGEAANAVRDAQKKLDQAEQTLEQARSNALTSSFAPSGAMLLAAPVYQGDYVFPVGGGPTLVSVGHHHHDYPAADIAAPEGAPLYALSDGFVVDAWHEPTGNCGIGLTMRSALDGREWTYCHMSYEEPAVQEGAALAAGQPVGLVGQTGHATGPHLHLQLQPTTSYPQDEAWFQGFVGAAFRWQDAPTMDAGPVFAVVGQTVEPAGDDPQVITFTTESS